MNKTNISNVANHIKSQLPTYISSDEDYSRFVKFLELYYEWMSQSDNPSGVTGDMTEYGDIDDTLEMFVSLYKNELASSFPNVVKIKGINEKNSENVNSNQLGNITETATESLYDQEFLMDGIATSFKLNYFNPFYYFGETDATSVVDEIVVFKNPATSPDRGDGDTLQSYIDNLTPPDVSRTGTTGDYVKLVENTDYVIEENFIKFVDSNGDPDTLVTNDIVKVRFYVKTYLDVSTTPDTEDGVKRLVESTGVKKTTYENQRNFLKFMKDFYQSKGTEKSYDFLFRAIFNEPIEIYYPKDNLFKASNNIWESVTSVRAIPHTGTLENPEIQNPYRITGKVSKATATVEYYKDFKVGEYDVREYFLTNIFGDFESQEDIVVSQTNGSEFEERLYECVVGFDITNAGSDYSRNQPIHYNLSSEGSGYGFAAEIDHTSIGKVESINIGSGGDGYIDGEHIEFVDEGTLGSGASGKVTKTSSTFSNYSVLFNQNPSSTEYIANGPQTIFDIGLSGDDYHDTAKDTVVSIENIDSKFSSVFAVYDFESIDNSVVTMKDDTIFSGQIRDLKSNLNGIRIDSSLVSTETPPYVVANIDPSDDLDTRYRNDMILSITSVDANGSITGVNVENSINGLTGGVLGTNSAGKTSSSTQVLPSPVNLENQSGRYESGNGFGAKFDISITDNAITSIDLSNSGAGFQYLENDVLKIDGSEFGLNGVSGTNDVFVKITATSSGTDYNSIIQEDIPNSVAGYTTTSVSGANASWNISTGMSPYPRLFSVISNNTPLSVGYKQDDVFTIPGNLVGGTTPANDITIIVLQVDSTGRIEEFSYNGISPVGTISTFDLVGTPVLPDLLTTYHNPIFTLTQNNINLTAGEDAQFFVRVNGAAYIITEPSLSERGKNYAIGDTVLIDGSVLGGVTSTNDLSFEISSVDSLGGITGITNISGVAANTFSISNQSAKSVRGKDAKFDIVITNDFYSASVSSNQGGTGYNVGQILTFKGSVLAHQWIKNGFRAKTNQVGANALFTDSGYMRLSDIGETFRKNSTDGITIDFWYFRKGTEISGTYNGASIFSINESVGGTQKTFLQQLPNGTLEFGNVNGGVTSTTTGAALSFGDWHHVAVFLGPTESRVYVDGQDYIAINDGSYFDISEYGEYTETITIASGQENGVSTIVYDPNKNIEMTVDYTSGPSVGTLVPVTPTTNSVGNVLSWPTLSVGDVVTLTYSKPVKNFYLGARQKEDPSYSIEDYNHAFFGTLRFSTGRRYEEVSGLIEDTGTDNSISGVGLNPIYVNPIPSVQTIRESAPLKATFKVTDINKSAFSMMFDINETPRIVRSVNSLNGLGEPITTSSDLIGPGETDNSGNPLTPQYTLTQALDSGGNVISGLGSGIAFSPDLGIDETIEIYYLSVLKNDVEYIIRNENHPVSANKISLRKSDENGIYSTYALPDGNSLRVSWSSKPRAEISSVSISTSGNNYMKRPYGYIKKETNGYKSQGSGAWFLGQGKDIGKIESFEIKGNSFQSEREGFGVNYTTAPVVDLSSFGDGQATATVLTGPLCIRRGEFLSKQGFLSDDNRLYDGYLWQDFSYVVKVGRYIDDWRKIVKKIVHPAGLMMFGEYSISTAAEVRKGAGIAWAQLIYEIIKNVNMKVKNMDGLGRWAYGEADGYWYPTSTRQDTNYLNSHGNIFKYDNRQLSVNSTIDGMYNGVGEGEVSDDTAGSTSVDTGSGRYALLQADGTNASGGWWQVKKIAINFKEATGKDYSHYYTSNLIGNTVTIYDVSDESMVADDWINTRPWGKYKITGAMIDSSIGERYVVYDVDLISNYLPDMPTWDNAAGGGPNIVEFRWDNIFRGNVDRNANSWIGSIMDGANPRDEKMIINISGRWNNNIDGDVPTLHTTWKSLERFKFYFRDIYPWNELVQQMFSPSSEMIGSPYNRHRELVQGNGLTHIAVRHSDYNMWYNLPVEVDGNNEWISTTDGTDHKWRNTVMSDVVTKSDRKYRAVLDSIVNISPVYLVMSEENPLSGTRKRMGPTNISVERSKFNNRLQPSLDYNKNLLDLNIINKYSSGTLHDKSNFASEATLIKYTVAPTTVEELNEILETSTID
jgi:hypothetical protein